MTTQGYATPVPTIFGEGAPAIDAANGVRYIDTVANAEYVRYGGAWNALGGGGGLPYTIGPYGIYIYGNSSPAGRDGIYLVANSPYGYVNIKAQNSFSLHGAYGSMGLNTSGFNLFSSNGIFLHLPTMAGAAGSLWNNLGVVTVA